MMWFYCNISNENNLFVSDFILIETVQGPMSLSQEKKM